MSKFNKSLIISVFLGVMFLGISANAMEANVKENKTIENKNEIKFLEGEEKFKKRIYGETNEEQTEIKEFIEEWGFNDEEVYNKMKTFIKVDGGFICKYKNLLECLIELMKERIEEFNNYIKEFETNPFKYEEGIDKDYFDDEYDFNGEKRREDYYDDFYGENDYYEVPEFKEKVLNLNGKNIKKDIILKYIDEVLSRSKKDISGIRNYKELIKKAYDEYIKKNRFVENGYYKDNKWYNVYNLNSVDMLKKEYEEKIKSINRFKEIINSDKEEDDVNILEDEKFDNRENEDIKWTKNWIDMWGGSLSDLYKRNKEVKIEDIKKHLKKIVIKDINTFNKAINVFRKYKCEFNYIGITEFEKDKNKFFDFNRLDEIIEEENKGLKEKYNFSIDKKIVSDYIEKTLIYNKQLIHKTKDYRELIKNAYITYIHLNNLELHNNIKNINVDKFYKEGYNFNIEKDNKGDIKYKGWKQGNFDIYNEKALEELKKQHDEIKFILEMRRILEEIKEQKEKIKEECEYFLKNKRLHVNSYLEILFKKMRSRIDIEGRNYFSELVLILNAAIVEDKFEEIVNMLISLTKEEYYPGRFVEKFVQFIKSKKELIEYVENICMMLDPIRKGISKKESQLILEKILNFNKNNEDNNYLLRKKLCEYLKEDLYRAENWYPHNGVESYYYMIKTTNLAYEYKLTFFEQLKELVEEEFKEKKAIDEMKEFLRPINFELYSYTNINFINNCFEKIIDCLKKIIDTSRDFIIENLKIKLEKIFKELEQTEVKRFIWDIVLIEYNSIEDFLKEFVTFLLENTYKKVQIKELKQEINKIVLGINDSNIESFKASDEYEILRKKCEKLYMLEHGQDENFCGVDIILEYDGFFGRYILKTIPRFRQELNNQNDDFYDYFNNDEEITEKETEQ